MSVVNRLRRMAADAGSWLARLSKYGTEAWELWERTQWAPGARTTLPPTRPDLIREYQTGLWTYACVSTFASVAAGIPWCLKRVVKGGVDEKVTEHEVLTVLERPQPRKTYSDLMTAHITYQFLGGAAFVEKLRKTKNTVPVGLSILRSDLASPIITPRDGIVGFSYRANTQMQSLSLDDVIYHPLFNPLNPDAGLPPVQPAWITLQMDKAAREWNWAFFENGAAPDVLLSSTEPVPPGEIQRVQADFEQRNSVARGRGRKAHVMPYSWKVDTMSASHREMQFERLLGMGQKEIAAVYHVPPVLLGLETMNYATADKQLQVFLWYHVVPMVMAALAHYTIELVEEWPDGDELYLDVDREELKTGEERAAEASSVQQDFALGLISRSEARVKRGYPAEEGAAPDEIQGRDAGPGAGPGAALVPEPVEAAGEAAVVMPVERATAGVHVAALSSAQPSAVVATKSAQAAKSDVAPARTPIRTPYQVEMAKADKAKAIERDMMVGAAKYLTIQRGKVAMWARKKWGTPAAKSANGGGNGQAHDDVREVDGHGDADADEYEVEDRERAHELGDRLTLLKADEPAQRKAISEEEIIEAIATPIGNAIKDSLRRAMDAGGDTTGEAIGISWDMKSPEVRDFYANRATNLEKVLDLSTAKMIKDTIKSAYNDGASEVQLVSRIMDSGAFSPGRARNIARTETHLAMQSGSFEAMKQADVERHQWLTALDDAVRPTHQAANGQEVVLGEPFKVGDAELLFPGDPNGPPEEVVNCFLPGTIVQGRINLAMRSWYEGPAVDLTTKAGCRIRLTAGHPVPTAGGTKRAGAIQKGDKLIAYESKIQIIGDMNECHGPAAIEDVFEAMRLRGGCRPCALGRDDLHGDALFVDGEIDIVAANGLLRGQHDLTFASADSVPGSGRTPSHLTIGAFDSANRVPCAGTLTEDTFAIGLERFPLHEFRFGPAADARACLREYSTETASGDVQFLRQLLLGEPTLIPSDDIRRMFGFELPVEFGSETEINSDHAGRLAGKIAFDEVIDVRRFHHVGHVYDLQSPLGWLIADGLMEWQCRCTTIMSVTPTSFADVEAALGITPAGGKDEADEKIEAKVTAAVKEIPRDITGRVRPDDVKPLRYEVGDGGAAAYDPSSRTATIGPKAKPADVQAVVEQHLVESVMSESDARGFRNQLVTAKLIDPDTYDAYVGTERAHGVRAVAAIVAKDRAMAEAELGQELDDEEWKRALQVAAHFWVVGRTGGPKPKKTNPK